MTTLRQPESDTRQSQASSDARIEPARAESASNYVRDGLPLEDILLDDEKPEEFRRFVASAMHTYEPIGALEEEAVEEIVVHLWRGRRHLKAECASLSSLPLQDQCAHAPQLLKHLGQYAAAVGKSLVAAMKRLETLQERRRRPRELPPINPRFLKDTPSSHED